MADLKTLEIDIVANANKANSAIDTLISKLGELSTALGGLSNSQNLSNLADGVSKLKTAMSGKSMRSDAFNSLAKNIQTLNGVNSDNLINISGSLTDLQMVLSGFSADSANGLRGVASSIQSLGNAKAGSSIANMPYLAKYVNDFANSIQGIPDLTAQATNLRSVVNQITNLGGTTGNNATANLPNIARDIKTFVDNLSGISSAGDNITKLAEMTKAIAQLGYQTSTQAVSNIPQLANNLKYLFETLSRCPAISKDLISMTRALAKLTQGLGNVRGSSQSASKGLDLFSKSSRSARTHAFSLASAIGKLYATYFLLFRLIRAVGKGIAKAMNVNEVQNYMQNAMKQVGRTMVKENGQAGTESAQAYLESYADELTKKQSVITNAMSGYDYDTNNNMLMRSDTKNLGMNPNDLIRYQAQFTQMADSMGACSDNAMKLSETYTKLGADLASVKDVDYADTWADMSSGMVGMSKVMDKYGINIRVQALNQRLMDMGIDTTVAKLDAEDKALLRTIVMLDESRYAWADLARTLDQPANQMRLLRNNVSALGMSIGSILLSGIARVLPYINALVVALQRLAQYIIGLFGITLPQTSASGVGGFGDLADSIYETEDAMDDASSSAKKLKNNLLGIDELNVISDNGGSGTGTGAGYNGDDLQKAFDELYDEYMKAWDEAYANMNDRINELANGIIDAFKSGDYSAIGEYIGNGIRKALQKIDWDSVYKGAVSFGTGLAQFLNGLISPELFGELGKTIANALNTAIKASLSFAKNFDWSNLGESLASGVNQFFRNFDFKQLAESINAWVHGIITAIKSFLVNVDWHDVFKGLWDFISNLSNEVLTITFGAILFNAIGGKETIIQAIKSLLAFTIPALDISVAGLVLTTAGAITVAGNITGIIIKSGALDVSGSEKSQAMNMTYGDNYLKLISDGIKTIMVDVHNLWDKIANGGNSQVDLGWTTDKEGKFELVIDASNIEERIKEGEIVSSKELADYVYWFGLFDGNVKTAESNVAEWNKTMIKSNDDLKKTADAFDLWGTTSADQVKIINDWLDKYKENSKNLAIPKEATDSTKEFLKSVENGTIIVDRYQKTLVDEQGWGAFIKSSDEISNSLAGVTSVAQTAGKNSYLLSQSAIEYNTQAQKMITINGDVAKGLSKVVVEQGKYSEWTKNLEDWETVGSYMRGLSDDLHSQEQGWYSLKGSVYLTTEGVKDMRDGSILTWKEMDRLGLSVEALGVLGYDTSEVLDLYNQNMEDVDSTTSGAIGSTDGFMQSMGVGKDDLLGVSDALKNITGNTDNAKTSFSNFEGVSKTFKDTFDGVKTKISEAVGHFSDMKTKTTESSTELVAFQASSKIMSGAVAMNMDMVKKKVDTVKDAVKDDFQLVLDWFNDSFKPEFTADAWNTNLGGVTTAFETTFTNACNVVINIVNRMIDAINSSVSNISWDAIEVDGEQVVAGGSAKLFEIPRIKGFAVGGYPDRGSLFMANEAGAEMVGNINGRTGVVSNAEITGIADAVRESSERETTMLMQQNELLRSILAKDTSVKIGDREIARANARGQRAMGRTIISTV